MSLTKIIKAENEYWSKVFSEELKNKKNNKGYFSSYWWKDYYSQIKEKINFYLKEYGSPKILEAGSGSGKASIILGKNINRTFLDISPKALDYARYLSQKFDVTNINLVNGNIFSMPFKNESFDFVWNIGVIEHYDAKEVKEIIKEMLRVTKIKGKIVLGVPNFLSGPIIKARILKIPLLNFIPGYRLNTEKYYTPEYLKEIIARVIKEERRQLKDINAIYVGNPLPVESPKWLIRSFGRILEFLFPKSKFMILIICELK